MSLLNFLAYLLVLLCVSNAFGAAIESSDVGNMTLIMVVQNPTVIKMTTTTDEVVPEAKELKDFEESLGNSEKAPVGLNETTPVPDEDVQSTTPGNENTSSKFNSTEKPKPTSYVYNDKVEPAFSYNKSQAPATPYSANLSNSNFDGQISPDFNLEQNYSSVEDGYRYQTYEDNLYEEVKNNKPNSGNAYQDVFGSRAENSQSYDDNGGYIY